tara:strand:- start:3461 stop:3940 length:480 start_codon:yes stop_codon:yes gene_type:complete
MKSKSNLGMNPFAEEALHLAARGQRTDGMSRTAAPIGPNLAMGGPLAQPVINAQGYSNDVKRTQNVSQNISTAIPQAQAQALGELKTAESALSQAEFEAQTGLLERISLMLYANDGGNRTLELGIPEVAQQVKQHVAEQKLMAYGINPQVPYTSNNFAA